MPRHLSAFWKDNAPWQACRTAEKFSVYKVSNSAQTQAYGNAGADQIGYFPEFPALLFRDVKSRKDDANESAVKRHSALPDLENVEWSLQITAQIVEQDVSEPAAH